MKFKIGDKVYVNHPMILSLHGVIIEIRVRAMNDPMYDVRLDNGVRWYFNEDQLTLRDKQNMFTYIENTHNIPTSFYSDWVKGLKNDRF